MDNLSEEKAKKIEDFIIILVKHRKLIIANLLIVTIAAIIISLLIPNKYTSTTSFISPKQKGGLLGDLSNISSTIKDLSKSLGANLGSASDEAYNYLVILQSRSASEEIIKEFNLRQVYDIDSTKPFEDVIDALKDHVDFKIEDEGNVIVSVTDKNPKRAADMANYYVKVLNEYSTKLSVTEARNNREFIGNRLKEVQKNIANIEDSLEVFSRKYNVLQLEDQMKAAIGVGAELKAEVEVAKIERDLLKNNYGESSPLVQQAEMKINELNKRLTSMNSGEEKDISSNLNLFLPFKKVPEIGVKYIRLKRDYEIQNKILEFIYPFYEQAKIEEQKDIPVVLVIDKAIPAEKKSSPKRSLIVIAAFILSLFCSVGYVLIAEAYSNVQEDDSRYIKIKNGIIDPLKNMFRAKRGS